jgi:endogenous inhibitor of DNA gyrase (YacG/DUF329 family)
MHEVTCAECGRVRQWEARAYGVPLCSDRCADRWLWRRSLPERRAQIEREIAEKQYDRDGNYEPDNHDPV